MITAPTERFSASRALNGNGQFELVERLGRLEARDSGSIRLDGRELAHASSPDASIAGPRLHAALDRGQTALVKSMSVAENLDAARQPPTAFASGAFLSSAGLNRKANALMNAYDIRAPSTETGTARLSRRQSAENRRRGESSTGSRRRSSRIKPAWGFDPGATRFGHRTDACPSRGWRSDPLRFVRIGGGARRLWTASAVMADASFLGSCAQ